MKKISLLATAVIFVGAFAIFAKAQTAPVDSYFQSRVATHVTPLQYSTTTLLTTALQLGQIVTLVDGSGTVFGLGFSSAAAIDSCVYISSVGSHGTGFSACH